MGRRHSRSSESPPAPQSWETERTLASAEEEQETLAVGEAVDTACLCGSSEFLLEAFLAVADGRPRPEPVELGSLTCPQCGREFEAVQTEDGRILRGEFLGYVEMDE